MTRGLVVLALVAAVVAGAWVFRSDGRAGNTPKPSAAQPLLPPSSTSSPAAVKLEGGDAFSIKFKKPPRAGLVFDVATGEVLWRRNPLKVLPIASLTKVMTALIVVTRAAPEDGVLITKAATRYEGRGVGTLRRGRRVPVEALLSALVITSANDAAIALARQIGGSVPGFAKLMNDRARVLGLRCTGFVSPHGLERQDRSCATDVAALARLAMAEKRISRVARIRYTQIKAPVKGKRLYLGTTNPLLASGYPGTLGLKTGFTEKAGRCLIAIVRRGRRTLGVVLLHSPNPNRQARSLLKAAFRAR